MFLRDRAAIVTGASKEIGAAMALALAREGAAVVIHYAADRAPAEALVQRILDEGGRAIAVGADCSRAADNAMLVQAAVRAFGRLDIFVANAGITQFGAFLSYTETDYDKVLNLNLKGSFFGAQAAARQMIEQRTQHPEDQYGGRIVFSSSVAGVICVPGLAAYGASKAALNHLTKTLAIELGPHRITVNALAIGPTTNARNLREDPHYEEHWGNLLPIGRAMRPEDSAAALLYLVSPAASGITGVTLTVDGGQSIQAVLPASEIARGK
ncbi:MAG: glucose 1-dehydrogenase [Anaerolineae bacterium]|nr:glucose 1-dehydrogenase [Thermoflexales bacterium]MDW8407512.1 glucose 1-dehydrogenase [Anaerolineae bacterium]